MAHLSFMHVVLTIAGSDSGGGAGIQADLKTFHQFGVFGASAITAITAQNTLGVRGWEPVSPELLREQIDVVAADLRPEAVKTGMLGTAELIRVVAAALRRHELKNYVLDPVMVATSGDMLIDADGARTIKHDLVPLAALVTPNTKEETEFTGVQIRDEETILNSPKRLFGLGANAALITGGHVGTEGDSTILDLFYDGDFTAFTHPRIESSSTHGTGCTLSAAIAAQLGQGVSLRDSVKLAIDYVHAAIESAPHLGSGHGPLNHFARGRSVTKERTSD